MSRKVINHDLRCVNGVTLYLPPSPLNGQVNLAQPDVMAQSATPLYPIGTLAWYQGIGKKYRYARAGASDLLGVKHLGANGNYANGASTTNLNTFYAGGSTATWDVGATEITFTDTIDRGVDHYAGSHMIHYHGAIDLCYEESYIMSGPTAATTDPWSTTVQLAEPTKYAKASGEGLEIALNPYSNIIAEVLDAHVTYMGMIPMPVTAYYYFWIQTAGPTFVTPDGWGANLPGYAVDKRLAMTNSGILSSATTLAYGHQIVGTILNRTSDTHGSPWTNLSLDLGD